MPACHRLIATLMLGLAPAGAARAQTPPAFAPGPGVAVVRTTCAACHPPSTITARRMTAQRWAEVVDQMIAKGAQVSDADYRVIVAYLSATYGPGKKG